MTIDIITRNLLISLCSHINYMQGQLEALHQLDDPDNYYWFRESVALRQKVADHLAALADEPAVPEGRELAAVTGQPSDEELLDLLPQGNESGFWLPKGLPSDWVDGEFIAPPKAIIAFARDVLELWGNPTPPPPTDGEVAELVTELQSMATDADRRCRFSNAEHFSRAAELLQRQTMPEVGE